MSEEKRIAEIAARNPQVNADRLRKVLEAARARRGLVKRATFNILPPFGGRFIRIKPEGK